MEALPVLTLSVLMVILLLSVGLLLRKPATQPLSPEADARLSGMEKAMQQLAVQAAADARAAREELREQSQGQAALLEQRLASFEGRLTQFAADQGQQFLAMRGEAADGRQKLEEAVKGSSESFARTQTDRLKETNDAMAGLSERLTAAQRESREAQATGLKGVTGAIEALVEQNNKGQEALRNTVAQGLEKVREENADKLEKMRATVDEKLQGTLEKRLGESFQLVSDRLEQVHKGLGEMQTLATGVGDLKRIMTNVKSRGGWGEAQLAMLLEDMLTPDQFASNVRIRPDSTEIVEFAVRLPGKGDSDTPLWLPIDAKLPHEDYDRLLTAHELGLADEIEKAAAALERAIRLQARTICEKYVHPPYSTDFAIMYLPTEGLFAEVVRRPGLLSELQNKHRIMVQGPTTLSALLTSLQMGFRTLAIEKRSSEVWQILAAAKSEFQKYGDVWEKLGKQLDTAKRTVDEAGKRTRAVNRRLRDVETLSIQSSPALLEAFAPDDPDNEFDSGADDEGLNGIGEQPGLAAE